MSEVKTKEQFITAIDWNKMSFERWLEQYGSWLLIGDHYESLGTKSILGMLLDKARGISTDGRSRVPPQCRITDDEAMAVEGLLLDLAKCENCKVKQWVRVVIMYFVEFRQEDKIAQILNVSEYVVKRDKLLGIVRIATKYNLHSILIG